MKDILAKLPVELIYRLVQLVESIADTNIVFGEIVTPKEIEKAALLTKDIEKFIDGEIEKEMSEREPITDGGDFPA